MTYKCTRVHARLFESPRHSGATDEGVNPRLLRMSLPGVHEGRRPMKIRPQPTSWYRRRSLQLARKVRRPAVRSKLGLGKNTCTRRGTPRDLAWYIRARRGDAKGIESYL